MSRHASAAAWCAVVTAIGCLPLWQHGFPQGHDWIFELVRVVEYADALRTGQWPPVWALHRYHGVGEALFLFYGHGFLFGASALTAVFGSVMAGAVAMLSLVTAVAAVAAYAWAQGLTGSARAARVASAAVALAPYFAANRLIRSANAEATAMAALFVALAGLAWLHRRPRAAGFTLFAGVAAMAASHNMVALYGTAIVLTLAAAHDRGAWRHQPTAWRIRARAAVAVVAGLLASAFYWLPAFSLRHSVIAGNAGTDFSVGSSFLVPADWWSGGFIGPGWPVLVALLLATATLAASAARDRSAPRPWALACATGVLVALGMTLAVSRPVWEHAPLLAYFQFSWRIFGVLTVGAAGVLAAGIAATDRWPRAAATALELALLALLALGFQRVATQTQPLPPDLATRAAADLNPERVRALGMAASLGDQFAPVGADPQAAARAPRGPGELVATTGALDVAVAASEPESIELGVRSTTGGDLTFARWSYPVWQARIDGAVVEHAPDELGLLVVTVPPGEHLVTLEVVQPPARRVANALSLLGVLLALGAAARAPRELSLDRGTS